MKTKDHFIKLISNELFYGIRNFNEGVAGGRIKKIEFSEILEYVDKNIPYLKSDSSYELKFRYMYSTPYTTCSYEVSTINIKMNHKDNFNQIVLQRLAYEIFKPMFENVSKGFILHHISGIISIEKI